MKNLASQILFFVSILFVALLTSCAGTVESENVHQVEEGGKGDVYGVALSPGETSMAVSTATGIYLYDFETLQQKQFIDLSISPTMYKSQSQSISFSPDGNLLAVSNKDIIIWNLSKNRIDGRINNRIANFNIVQLAFSPQGNAIVAISMGHYDSCDAWGGNFAVYGLESGDMLYNDFFCPEAALFHFSFLENGNLAFIGTSSNSVYDVSIVDISSGALIKKLSYEGIVYSISFDSSKIALRDLPYRPETSTKIIDTNTQKVIESIDGVVIFLPDNRSRLIQTKKNWIITTNENKVLCELKNFPNLSLVAYRSIFTLMGDKLLFWNNNNQSVEVWELSQCKLVKQLKL